MALRAAVSDCHGWHGQRAEKGSRLYRMVQPESCDRIENTGGKSNGGSGRLRSDENVKSGLYTVRAGFGEAQADACG